MMPKKILLINSDLAKNRGDRAIAEGIVELAKNHFKNPKITGLSEYAERDSKWFDIEFLKMDAQSLKLTDLLRLMAAAKKADVILWGGGELLKDYTNKLALWYWALKMFFICRMNNNIYGAFQGIGPTSSRASKLLIAHIINNCQKFIVRDYESYEKLLQWGARLGKVIPSSDPAILPRPQPLNNELKKKLQKDFQIDEAFLKNFVSFSPRSWFHYKPGGILPFRYKKALLRIIGQKLVVKEDRFILYRSQLVSMADLIISEHNMNILLVPMHMSEDDVELCNYIKKHARESKKIRILAKDTLSPTETRSLIARAKVAVGFRLHSTIISTSCGVPSLNIYYVDKGRVFFDQIKQSYYALPIEKVLDKNFISQFSSLFTELEQNRQKIKKDLEAQITSLRDSIEAVFREIP